MPVRGARIEESPPEARGRDLSFAIRCHSRCNVTSAPPRVTHATCAVCVTHVPPVFFLRSTSGTRSAPSSRARRPKRTWPPGSVRCGGCVSRHLPSNARQPTAAPLHALHALPSTCSSTSRAPPLLSPRGAVRRELAGGSGEDSRCGRGVVGARSQRCGGAGRRCGERDAEQSRGAQTQAAEPRRAQAARRAQLRG